jgi:hypothetical protein
MRFPDMPSNAVEAHASAVERLGQARDRQADLTVSARSAEGTSAEAQTADALRIAQDRVAASEAWVVWVERGL